MSGSLRKNRFAFRPTLSDFRLEERVVLNATTLTNNSMPVQFPTVVTGVTQVGQPLTGTQPAFGQLSMRQIRLAFRQQLASTFGALQDAIRTQAAALHADPSNFVGGRLTAEALANFRANVNGALNATALRLSAQASLLPGSSSRLIPNLQSSLLGSQRNALGSRISQLLNSERLTGSTRLLQNAMNAQVRQSLASNMGQLSRFLATTPFNRLSVEPTLGQPVPLSQFMANQAMSQVNNVFGTLANSTIGNAQSALFDATGGFNNQGTAAFQQQFNNALGTAAFQLASMLSVFPNASTTLGTGLQSSLFAMGTDPITGQPVASFLNGLLNTIGSGTTTSPLTVNGFNTGFQNAFTNAFQNVMTPLSTFLGITPTTGTGGTIPLPNGFFQSGATFPSVFGSQFTSNTFNGGFNNGFATNGTGFPGFGTAPVDFNTGFSTGFNNFTGTFNQQFGLTVPTFGFGTGPVGVGTPPGPGVPSTETPVGTTTAGV